MLSLTPQLRVFLCTRPTDMRKSFDGLLALAQEHLARDVLEGGLFVFVNRRRDRVKILAWEGDGLSIYYKKLEAENVRMFGFTEVSQDAHNGRVGPVGTGRLVGISSPADPRR